MPGTAHTRMSHCSQKGMKSAVNIGAAPKLTALCLLCANARARSPRVFAGGPELAGGGHLPRWAGKVSAMTAAAMPTPAEAS